MLLKSCLASSVLVKAVLLSLAFVCFGRVFAGSEAEALALNSHESPNKLDVSLDSLIVLPEDIRTELVSLVNSLDVMDAERSPFCSGRVATLLQQCTRDTLDADDRIEAATLMTLCDRARDYRPPMECENLALPITPDRNQVRECSIALDQHQNFQRTFDAYRILVIPEKCKSLNSMFNVQPAQELYRNMTSDMIDFIRSLAKMEMRDDEFAARWESNFNMFEDAINDLASTKQSLAEYNEQTMEGLQKIVFTAGDHLEDLQMGAQKSALELFAHVEEHLSSIGAEHKTSLRTALATVEESLSSSMEILFNTMRGQQLELAVATSQTVSEMANAVAQLSSARHSFEDLSEFVRESTSKALSQAILLDTKQNEVSHSLDGLATQVQDLSVTAFNVNETLSGSFLAASASESTWLGSTFVLFRFYRWLGVSPIWFLLLLLMSLPRYVVQHGCIAVFWASKTMYYFAKGRLLAHRSATSNHADPERSTRTGLGPFSFLSRDDYLGSIETPLRQPPPHYYAVPESPLVSKSTIPPTVLQTAAAVKQIQNPSTNQVPVSRPRLASRIPARLYQSEMPPARRF